MDGLARTLSSKAVGSRSQDLGEALPQQVAGRALGRDGHQREVLGTDRLTPPAGDRRQALVTPEVAGDGRVVVLGPYGAEVVVPRLGGPVLHGLQPHRGNVAGQVAPGQDDFEPAVEGVADDLDLAGGTGSQELHRHHDRAGRGVDARDQRLPRAGRIERRLVGAAVRDQVLHGGDLVAPSLPREGDPVLGQLVAVVAQDVLDEAGARLHRADVEDDALSHAHSPSPTKNRHCAAGPGWPVVRQREEDPTADVRRRVPCCGR